MDNEEVQYIQITTREYGQMKLGSALAEKAHDAIFALAERNGAAYIAADIASILFCGLPYSDLCELCKEEKEENHDA